MGKKRCIGEELMKTSQPTSPHVIWKTRPISPRYRMTKDVPRPLFPRRQLSHAIVLCMENFPKPLFSFRIAVLFLSFLPTTLIYRLPKLVKHVQTWSMRWSVRKGQTVYIVIAYFCLPLSFVINSDQRPLLLCAIVTRT